MEKKKPLIHLELVGDQEVSCQIKGKPKELLFLLATAVSSMAKDWGFDVLPMALAIGTLADELSGAEKETIDLGAVERAKEAMDHDS